MKSFTQKAIFTIGVLCIFHTTFTMIVPFERNPNTPNQLFTCLFLKEILTNSGKQKKIESVLMYQNNNFVTILPAELQYKIFNQLSPEDKNNLMRTCSYLHDLGKMIPNHSRFVFDPVLVCSSQDLNKLAQLEMKARDHCYNNILLDQMNAQYVPARQVAICSMFQELHKKIDAETDKQLSILNILKHCFHLWKYCSDIECNAIGKLPQSAYLTAKLEHVMNKDTKTEVDKERTLIRNGISLQSIKNCALFRLFNCVVVGIGAGYSIWVASVMNEMVNTHGLYGTIRA